MKDIERKKAPEEGFFGGGPFEGEKDFFEKEEGELFGKENEHGFDEDEHENPSGKDEDDEKALLGFIMSTGKSPEELRELILLGEKAAEEKEELLAAKADSEIIGKLAKIRGIPKEEMKNELLWALERANREKMLFEIMQANPGMNREIALELAQFRLGMKKPEMHEHEMSTEEKMLRELEDFLERHSAEKIEYLSEAVIGEWEKGLSLEAAFEKERLFDEKEALLRELSEIKKEKMLSDQAAYRREHSTKSGKSSAGILLPDDFAAGLFREY